MHILLPSWLRFCFIEVTYNWQFHFLIGWNHTCTTYYIQLFWSSFDQQGRKQAKSREHPAISVRENVQAREKWKSAKSDCSQAYNWFTISIVKDILPKKYASQQDPQKVPGSFDFSMAKLPRT